MRGFAFPLLVACLAAPPKNDPTGILKSTYDEAGRLTTHQHKDQSVDATGIDVMVVDRGGIILNTTLNFRLRGTKPINLTHCEVWVNGSKYEVRPEGKVQRSLQEGEAIESFSAPAVRDAHILLYYLQTAKKATVRFHGDQGVVDHEVRSDELQRIRDVVAARKHISDRRFKEADAARRNKKL